MGVKGEVKCLDFRVVCREMIMYIEINFLWISFLKLECISSFKFIRFESLFFMRENKLYIDVKSVFYKLDFEKRGGYEFCFIIVFNKLEIVYIVIIF